MTNLFRSLVGRMDFPPQAQESVRIARQAVATLAAEATGLYRLGGFLGILLGGAASIVAHQTRRLGRWL